MFNAKVEKKKLNLYLDSKYQHLKMKLSIDTTAESFQAIGYYSNEK